MQSIFTWDVLDVTSGDNDSKYLPFYIRFDSKLVTSKNDPALKKPLLLPDILQPPQHRSNVYSAVKDIIWFSGDNSSIVETGYEILMNKGLDTKDSKIIDDSVLCNEILNSEEINLVISGMLSEIIDVITHTIIEYLYDSVDTEIYTTDQLLSKKEILLQFINAELKYSNTLASMVIRLCIRRQLSNQLTKLAFRKLDAEINRILRDPFCLITFVDGLIQNKDSEQ